MMNAEAREPDRDFDALALGQRLEALYRDIHRHAMADVPICNPALDVAAIGFRSQGSRAFGILVTPWFMNLVTAPLNDGDVPVPVVAGATVRYGLPAGEVDFLAGELSGFGRLDSCSLFSPMFEFATMQDAADCALAAAEAFFDRGALLDPPPPRPEVNRRDLLRGRLGRTEEASP